MKSEYEENYRDVCEIAKAYCKKRDSAVMQAVSFGNCRPMRRLFRKNRISVPDDDALIRIAHEICCHSPAIPELQREKSERWLCEHGLRSDIISE